MQYPFLLSCLLLGYDFSQLRALHLLPNPPSLLDTCQETPLGIWGWEAPFGDWAGGLCQSVTEVPAQPVPSHGSSPGSWTASAKTLSDLADPQAWSWAHHLCLPGFALWIPATPNINSFPVSASSSVLHHMEKQWSVVERSWTFKSDRPGFESQFYTHCVNWACFPFPLRLSSHF